MTNRARGLSREMAALREQAPLVHCLTNIVAAGFSANALLALGASPAMVENAEESGEFAGLAGAVLANLGTLSEERDRALRAAVRGADNSGTPWVLDPVAVGALRHRTELAADLVRSRPTVVRGNAAEVLALAGNAGSGKGVESLAGSEAAIDTAREFAGANRCVVAVSGKVDYVTDGTETVEVPGGHPLMAKITGMGCALGASTAAFLAVTPDAPVSAAVTASRVFAEAGERAGASARGPGSFVAEFVDELHTIGGDA